MPIDELDDYSQPPKKWLDKKKYFRVDPETGQPQLIRVEPVIEGGEFNPDNVNIFIDETHMVMGREAADNYLESMGVTPMEEFPQWWKQQHRN